ncbi:hypothetical protein PR048_018611 [Dryococelus australis]|uniref:Mutator-like transposase domain-containing protein n=1 Tax=Dryococelus australis TaxID=614101 RepID=A0ABQ9HCT4_9NEOP|nr:hypothetical protein PR048_018611 [Dryococelus australis]
MYGQNFTITKIECSNHILRNYIRRIRGIAQKTKNEGGPVSPLLRKAMSDKQLHLRAAVTGVVHHSHAQKDLSIHKKIEELKLDIYNDPFHVFGDHTGCESWGYFCSGSKENEENVVPSLQRSGIWQGIIAARNIVAHHARKELTAEKIKRRRMDNPQKLKRIKLQMSGPDCDYGCIELGLPDMEPDFLREIPQSFLPGQSDSLLWKAERFKRLTASHFGTICKMKKSTKRGKSVVNILYIRFSGTAATRYGLENERNAVEDFEFKSSKKVARWAYLSIWRMHGSRHLA